MWQDRLLHCVVFTKTSEEFAQHYLAEIRHDMRQTTKVAGIIAAAVAGTLLKPDFGWWAALGAAVVIALYMILMVCYYLPTVQRANDLRMDQHQAYIQSFREVLREEEIQDFLGDTHLGKVETMFSNRSRWAVRIYMGSLFVSLGVIAVCVFMFVSKASSTTSGKPRSVYPLDWVRAIGDDVSLYQMPTKGKENMG